MRKTPKPIRRSALPANVALLDREGTVVAVNRAVAAAGCACVHLVAVGASAVLARAEAVDHRFDRVLLAQRERRHGIDLMQHAIHAHAHDV